MRHCSIWVPRKCSSAWITAGFWRRLTCRMRWEEAERAWPWQLASLPAVGKSRPRPSAPLCARFPARAPLPAPAPLCAWVLVHTLKLLFSSFNHILQLISCFLADSLSKSNLWQVLIWVMTTWSTFLVGNYWVRSGQIWYPLTVSKAGVFTTRSLEIHW